MNTEMDYIVCTKPGHFELKQKEIPRRREGEALLKIKKVGVCGTDLHAYQGNQAYFTYPRILGHELAVEIVEIGEHPQGLKPGDKAVVMPYVSCMQCVACRQGKTNCCEKLKVLGVHTDGGMQELISIPVELLLPANNLTDTEVAIIEPLAIGAHALARAALQAGEVAIVMGCGPIGLGIIKLAKMAGATVIALDMNESRLQVAREVMGADHIVCVSHHTEKEISSITHGDMAAVIFDATGNKKAIEAAPALASHGGRFVIVGLTKTPLEFVHPTIHAKELSILCSRNATPLDFKYIMDRMQQFPVDLYVTHTVGYRDMLKHFDNWLDPGNGVIKAMVDFA